MTAIEPMRIRAFNRKLSSDKRWKETFDALCSSYEKLKPSFSIKPDKFGGYRLVYVGTSVVYPPHVFKRTPVGFFASVTEGVVTDLSVMSSERTGEEVLLLGPIRFVDLDCNPNCEYDFSSDAGIVQLRVRKRINPGEEVFVKYGPEFFEHNACKCRTCYLDKLEMNTDYVFDSLLQDEILLEVDKTLVEPDSERSNMISPISGPVVPKRRRIRGRELIEFANDMTTSPLSVDRSSVSSISQIDSNPSQQSFPSHNSNTTWSSPNDAQGSSSESQSGSKSANSAVSEGEISEPCLFESPALSEFLPIDFAPIVESPNTSSDNNVDEPLLLSNSSKFGSAFLYDGSKTTVDEATALIKMFCSRFNLSDECSSTMHTMIRLLLPPGNMFPSGFSYIQSSKKQFEEEIGLMQKSPRKNLCVINYRFQLRDLTQLHLNSILDHSHFRIRNPNADLNCLFSPAVKLNNQKTLSINLILFSDGVNIKKSTLRKERWPVWVQIADLPPRLRMSCQNIVLAALFVGITSPNWSEIVPHLRSQLQTGVEVCHNGVSFRAFFNDRLLVSDMGAKSNMLNMFKFNGFYGCHYCTAAGKTIGQTHAYYPYQQEGTVRDSSVNDRFVQCAELLSANELFNVAGVKGKSAFVPLIDGLPLTAPIDYMHCVLQGVLPDVLKLCFKSLATDEKNAINSVLSNLSCPREMIAYS